MAKVTKFEEEEAREELRKLVHPGDTIYTTLVHVSRSGMYRVIGLHIIRNNEPQRIDYLASKLLEGYDRNHTGCKASGCGMDMGYHLVYGLSSQLWPDGFECIGPANAEGGLIGGAIKSCPSNAHTNGDRDYTPHPHGDGGYALRHRWL